MTISITVAMKAVLDLATEMGVTDINRLPYCWELTLDGQWWFAVNGHGERTRCFPPAHPEGSEWPNVPPYGVYAERYGWPAVIFDANHGCWIGTPQLEDEFIAAVRATIRDIEVDKLARLPRPTHGLREPNWLGDQLTILRNTPWW